ncbi:MAG: hypothetical protein WA759_17935 [Pseudolabrys sp.]
MSVNTRYDSALADSRSLLDELISPVATATAKHRLRIIDRITDLFAAGSRSYSHEQVRGLVVRLDFGPSAFD